MGRPVKDYAVLDRYRVLIDGALERHIKSVDELPGEVRQALRYATAGGKRIRPTVTLLACESVGGRPQDALAAALAVECIHCSSLIIDDVIDENAVRRGQESVHARFGTDLAVMVALVVTTRALRLVADDSELIGLLVAAVDDLSVGEILDMRGGRAGVANYLSVASKKTGALFRIAAETGGISGAGSADQCSALRSFGQNLGIAFQIRDDVLDAVGDADALGKPTGGDLRSGSPSMVSVLLSERLGIPVPELLAGADGTTTALEPEEIRRAADEAMVTCNSYVDRAARALDDIPDSSSRRHMMELLDYAVTRWD